MWSTYKKFLSLNRNQFLPKSIWSSLKLTRKYYKERALLKSTHKLRLIDVPYLYFLQLRQDSERKKRIALEIAEKLKSEKIEDFQQASTIKAIKGYMEGQITVFRQEGARGYLRLKASSFKDSLGKVKLEVVSKWVVGYVNLYHKSLEEMVEGHREVTRNHDTILEDGKTVKEKLEKFEEKLTGSKISYKLNHFNDSNIK